GTAATGTIVNENPVLGTYGTLQLGFGASTDFTIQNEFLTINGVGYASNGALFNFAGKNTWNGAITLGSPSSGSDPVIYDWINTATATTLTVNGVVQGNTGSNKRLFDKRG